MFDVLGRYHTLSATRATDNGMYLQLADQEVLLPARYVPADLQPGGSIEVFVYTDSEDRLVATTERPAGQVGDIVALPVVDKVAFGVFMDWGLAKHLLVPRSEMGQPMEVGQRYVVRIMVDYRSNRLIGVNKLAPFLETPADLQEGQQVDGLVYDKGELGYRIICNGRFAGLLYHNRVYRELATGEAITCYVDNIRADGKVDLRLTAGGLTGLEDEAAALLAALEQAGGFLPLTDKTAPEVIKMQLGLSKKAFKRALGRLYKARQVAIEAEGIRRLA